MVQGDRLDPLRKPRENISVARPRQEEERNGNEMRKRNRRSRSKCGGRDRGGIENNP